MNMDMLLDWILAQPVLKNTVSGKLYTFIGMGPEGEVILLREGAELRQRRKDLSNFVVVQWAGKIIDPPFQIRKGDTKP